MVRDITKYASHGEKRLAKENGKYDLVVSEIQALMIKASKSPGDLFDVIHSTYCLGVEAGARITTKHHKASV